MDLSDISVLKDSILQYESQLSQLQAAMAVAMTEEERSGLASLCRDISELIALTKENLQSKQPKVSDDPLDQEYLLFKAALGEEISSNDEPKPTNDPPPDIGAELKALEGLKCQAPYKQQYGSGVTYHNAMVTRVDSDSTEGATDTSHIQVRVVFVNPTQQAMRLCPYYLDGKCRFTDDKCRYSHGQLVPLSDLREYNEPDFSLVKKGSRVLALGAGELWRCASVQELENSNGQRLCHVRFEESGDEALLELHSVLPIQGSSDSEASSSEEEEELNLPDEETLALANRILMNKGPTTALGAWEQHTRGIGSKLMAKMGYITGSGLGIRGNGKVEPVEAYILPPGKSLDHCMRLKESTGDQNLFKAEKKLRRQRLKLQKQQQKKYEREKERTKGTVFDFINNYLAPSTSAAASTSSSSSPKTNNSPSNHQNDSSRRGLNVRGFQLSEEIRRVEQEVSKLGQSVSRLGQGSAGKAVSANLAAAKEKLEDLRRQQCSVEQESSRRRDRHKMTSF